MFAKLYGTDDDQVLVMLDTDKNNDPRVNFFFQPPSFGVCSFGVGFKDTDAGWDQAEAVFASIDEEKARKAIADSVGHLVDAAQGE